MFFKELLFTRLLINISEPVLFHFYFSKEVETVLQLLLEYVSKLLSVLLLVATSA